jgi:hypothetical protein
VETVLIGMDDTDNLDSRGTGYRARQLAERLRESKLAQTVGVTRHQLLVDDRIPYTSHNSSACVAVRPACGQDTLTAYCRDFLLEIAAEGSDAGLCIATEAQAERVAAFGRRAQSAVLEQSDATNLAARHEIHLEGLTGTRQGVIGALAAVGLHADGNDGRYLWNRGLRELAEQTMTLGALRDSTNIDRISQTDGAEITDAEAVIELGPWPRTVRIDKQSVLLVERLNGKRYKVLDKDIIKSIRP